jgi:hypothetical protein
LVLPELPSVLKRVNVPVIEDGHEVGPLPPGEMQEIIQLAQLGQMVRIRKSLEREHFQGKVDSRDLNCTEERQFVDLTMNWPEVPWATASFHNYGPNTAYIGINDTAMEHPLEIDEDFSVDLTKGDRRIDVIYYWCGKGETALLRVVGKY